MTHLSFPHLLRPSRRRPPGRIRVGHAGWLNVWTPHALDGADPTSSPDLHRTPGTASDLPASGGVDPIDSGHPADDQLAANQVDRLRALRKSQTYGGHPTSLGVFFVYPLDLGASVHVAGDFNHWHMRDTPLIADAEHDVWYAAVILPEGRYRYRLIVDGHWAGDPWNPWRIANPFGSADHVVEVRRHVRLDLDPEAEDDGHGAAPA